VVDALDENFKSADAIRKLLQDAPRYGNDNDYVDQIAVQVGKSYCQEVSRIATPAVEYTGPGCTGFGECAYGDDVGALPSGDWPGNARRRRLTGGRLGSQGTERV